MTAEGVMISERGRELIEDNPFVDVAAFLFLEDIAEKQGEAGMNNYLVSLASSLAKSMPSEEYNDWKTFIESLRNRESIMSTFEVNIISPTDYCIVSVICPYKKGLLEYIRRIGELSQQHFKVAEYYNNTVKPAALTTCCVICQTFRNFAAERIKVGGKSIKYSQISNVLFDGTQKRAPIEWLPILLEKAKISLTKLNMLQRTNECIWLVYPEI
ncbi:MAG: hypothetical protein KAJ51_13855 [Thermoplasmata archaeon]|nr:hypothetical protein [Thermoplasmata archaeon]